MTKEIPRELSVCAHVLNNDSGSLVINDLTKDDREKAKTIPNLWKQILEGYKNNN